MEWANKKLSDDFGFELVPLPVVTGMSVASAKTNQSRRAVVTRKAKAENSKSAPPQTFGLISNLLQNQRAMLPRASRDKVRLAILHSILMIISLSGNCIEHLHLIASLNEINLCRSDSKDFPQKDLDSFLEQLKREKYILKEKRNATCDSDSVYSWGPRAYIEFPSKNMSDFLLKVKT